MKFVTDWRPSIDFDKMRQERVKKAQEYMKKAGLDALLVFKPENIRYITGLRPLWWPSPQFRSAAILTPNSGPICYVTSGDWPHRAANMYWLPQENIRPLAALEDPVGIDKALPSLVKGMDDLDIRRGRVGIDITNRQIDAGFEKYCKGLEFVDGDMCMKEARLIKNSEEIKLFKIACESVSVAFEKLFSFIEPGKRECEIWGQGADYLYSLGMEIPQCNCIVASGDNLDPLARFASDRIIHWGDLVFIDMGGCFNGMFAEATRTISCGKPNDTQKKIYSVVLEAMDVIIKTIKPGVANREVFEVTDKVFEKHDMNNFALRTVLGHSIGTAGWEAPTIGDPSQTGADFIFEPGMVFSIEPTIIVPGVPGGGGIRIEDEIVVTETGCEVLTRIPHDEKLLV